MNCFLWLNSLLLLLLWSVENVKSKNVLYVAAVASPSHHIWNRALAFGLAKKGYNVTHIGPDQDNLPKPQNYTHIHLEGVYQELIADSDLNEMATYGSLRMMYEFEWWCIYQCELNFKSSGFRKLLSYPDDFKFDLIIFDMTPGSCMYPLIHRFNYPPTVGVSPFILPPYVSHSLGNNLYPAYLPWYGLPYGTDMNFIERVWNFIFSYIDLQLRQLYQYNGEHQLAKKAFGEDIPSMEDLEKHISLVLSNTDPILDYPQPIPPNIIPVGGLHTRKAGPLPDDLKKVLDDAKHGVILMSLGTNIRSDKLPKESQKAILEVFSKLPQTVIWKFESDIQDIPKNVIMKKWLPQNDILGHPNVKLFIGHGGALSTQETIYHGVPTVLIPFIVDQYINSIMIVKRQLGVQIDFKNITTQHFSEKVREVLENPVYTRNIKKLSALYRDRTETPLERGIFWIEYVIRHGGASFLNPPARSFPFYKRASLDVVIFLIAVVYVAFVIIFKVVSFAFKCCTKNKKIKKE